MAEIVHRTLHAKPADATHWSTRAMAETGGLSRETVRRIWNAFGLQPHRAETFTLSTDPLFAEKARDICGLYLNPPVLALVLSVDEKSKIQARERTQTLLPIRLGHSEHAPTTTNATGLPTSAGCLPKRAGIGERVASSTARREEC